MNRFVAARRPRRRVLCLSVVLALACAAPAFAATVSGRVTDASGDVGFKGARVRLVELGRDVASGRDGRFAFDGIAPGRYELTVEYVGAPTHRQTIEVGGDDANLGLVRVGADVARLDNILVVGQAAGQASAINQQRAADTIKNVVSADAIGQLPDQNVTEALQRIPGVSITRDQGEGRYVVVRGVDPNLNAVSIGGVRVPGPESDGRQIQLDVIPSELLAAIDVDKTVTPDMDADALGGSIDIKTVSAFDRAGDTFKAKIEGGYNDNAQKWSPKASVGGTRLFNVGDGERNFGVAFAANFNRRHLATENIETDGGWNEYEAADGSTGLAPETIEQRAYTSITRTREAYALNLDYQASDSTTLYLRTLYSAFKDQEERQANVYVLDDGEALSSANGGALFGDGARIDKTVKLRSETARIRSYDFGGRTESGPWALDYGVALSSSDEHEPDRIDATFEGEEMDVGFAGANRPTPYLYAGDPSAAADANNYTLDELTIEHNYTHDEERQFRVNVRRELDAGLPAWIKFGVKARHREKTGDTNASTYEGFGDDDVTLAQLALAGISSPFGVFGPGIAPRGLRDLIRASGGGFERDEAATLEDSRGGDFTLRENVDATYFMGGVDLGDVRLVGGVRGERTRFRALGNRVLIDDDADLPTIVPQAFSRSYTDWLPNLNLRYALDDEWLLRAAYTQNVVRANFADLAPAAVVEIEHDDGEIERQGEFGNPALDPYRSRNLDVSIEWYPDDALGVFTVGAYAKQIRDFVVRADLGGTGDYADYDEAIVPINGDTAKLRGIEFGWTRRLGDVAPWLDGLLISANASFSHSQAQLAGRDGDLQLPNQSDRNANLVLGYERSGLDLRLAAAYIGKRLVRIDDIADEAFDVFEAPHFQVDFTAKYRFLPQWQAYVDVANVTDRPLRETYRNGLLSRYESYGRTVQVGIEAEF